MLHKHFYSQPISHCRHHHELSDVMNEGKVSFGVDLNDYLGSTQEEVNIKFNYFDEKFSTCNCASEKIINSY